MYIQQGDVLIKETASIPKGAKKLKGDLVHNGQSHHHRMRGCFSLHEFDGRMYIRVSAASDLFHEEHKTLEIPKGTYVKDVVQEYDHFLEESRAVID